MYKIDQSEWFLGRLLEPLLGNLLKQYATSVLIPLQLTTAAAATDAAIYKKIFGSGFPLDIVSRLTTLMISNEEMNDIMKIVKSREESALLIKGVSD